MEMLSGDGEYTSWLEGVDLTESANFLGITDNHKRVMLGHLKRGRK